MTGTFVAVTTSNFAFNGTPPALPLLTSPNLYQWTRNGYVFPKGKLNDATFVALTTSNYDFNGTSPTFPLQPHLILASGQGMVMFSLKVS